MFQLERPVFLREQANQLYGVCPYWLAKNVIELPVTIVAPMLQLLIVYFAVGFKHSATDFLKIYLVIWILAQNAIGMGLVVSSLANNITTATSAAPLMTMPNVLFGGMLANSGSLPSYISWCQYLTPVRYANEAFSTVALKGVNYLTDYYLDLLGFDLGYSKCVFILIGFMIFWRLLSVIFLRLMISKFQ